MRVELIRKFQSREAHIAIIGMGYVGLPLAVVFAEAGYQVTGIDLDQSKIEAVNCGQSYIEDIPSARLARLVHGIRESGTGEVAYARQPGQPVKPLIAPPLTNGGFSPTLGGTLRATADFSVLSECDAVSICVPTPLNKTGDPDISYITAVADEVARFLHRGQVVVLESTSYPGTTREILLPRLETEQHGLKVGHDVFLAFSPERVDPGRTDWTTQNTPKVIGGVTPACLEVATAYYAAAVATLIPVSSPDAAELTKLFENTFRSVNIGLANELLLMCDKLGLDAWEVIEAAATKPFGFMKFTPGPGLGGHCIPVDPHYLSWKLRTVQYNARFIELASEINTEMPRYWVQKVQDALNEAGKAVKGSKILVLGVAYKKDVGDLRESPAIDIIHLLEEKGAKVGYHDPHVPFLQVDGMELVRVNNLDAELDEADCVVIATDHSAYDWGAIRQVVAQVVDTRHVI